MKTNEIMVKKLVMIKFYRKWGTAKELIFIGLIKVCKKCSTYK